MACSTLTMIGKNTTRMVTITETHTIWPRPIMFIAAARCAQAAREIRDGLDEGIGAAGRLQPCRLLPRAADVANAGALRNLPLLAHTLADALKFFDQGANP